MTTRTKRHPGPEPTPWSDRKRHPGPEPDARWSDRPDARHPVRWTSADGDGTLQWTTLDNAVDRLAAYGLDRAIVRAELTGGRQLRTPFAYYVMAAPGQDIEP